MPDRCAGEARLLQCLETIFNCPPDRHREILPESGGRRACPVTIPRAAATTGQLGAARVGPVYPLVFAHPAAPVGSLGGEAASAIECRSRLGGLLDYYHREAA
jgi:hypothetical protein